MKNLTDFEIIESIKRGNHSDFSILVDRYKNKAFSLLKRMLKNDMEAEELLQDAFIKTFNGLKNFKKESKFSTWFYRIVYNTALTKLSSKKRKIENEMTSVEDHLELKSKIDYNQAEQNNISEIVNSLIEQLPEKYSLVINLFYLNGMSCEEIADVTSSSVSNVKVLLHRARNSFKDILVKYNLTEELR
ncbi:MAG: sigma-70 family RNA polymerase sigma factor [Ignavibacteriaceae bacterium]|jgi:RNA polymerase sigma factor (sigma-70 family)